jgi:hypothetical protein
MLQALAGCTSTQIGAMGECVAAAGILEGSVGRLSPFKPVADDDGMDLLLFDKLARKAIPLQIKTRRSYDDPKAQTVQFDVRLKTFAREGEGYVLCIKLDAVTIDTLWLIPAAEFAGVAKESPTHLIIVPSAKPTSRDRFTPYRVKGFGEVADRIIARL